MGFNLSSEDTSELGFLLVENYNYDRFCWRKSAGNFWPVAREGPFIGCGGDAAGLRKGDFGMTFEGGGERGGERGEGIEIRTIVFPR